jgi:hypothetical protein
VTLRLGPTTDAYDPETEAQTITWEQETTGVEALQYSDKSTRDNKNQMVNFETRVQSFIVLGASVTAGRPNQSGNVTDADGITWQIAECLTDPTNAIWIFHCTT